MRLLEDGSVVRHRCLLRRKDGLPLHVLKNAAVLRRRGAITGGVETLTDITDLVAKERTIKELKGLLSPGDGLEGIIGRSPRMVDLYALIRNAASSMRLSSFTARAAREKSWWQMPSMHWGGGAKGLSSKSVVQP